MLLLYHYLLCLLTLRHHGLVKAQTVAKTYTGWDWYIPPPRSPSLSPPLSNHNQLQTHLRQHRQPPLPPHHPRRRPRLQQIQPAPPHHRRRLSRDGLPARRKHQHRRLPLRHVPAHSHLQRPLLRLCDPGPGQSSS